MCNVQNKSTARYSLVDSDAPDENLKTDGERFIKLLSHKQLNKTADLYKIHQNSSNFEKGLLLPVIGEEVVGLKSLVEFEQKSTNDDCADKRTENLEHTSTSTAFNSKNPCYLLNNASLRNCLEEATSIKPNSVETKLLAFYMKNQQCLKKIESPSHREAFNEIIKLSELQSHDVKEQFELVNNLRKEQLNSNKPKRKVLRNYHKSLWDVKRCTKFKNIASPKEYTCTSNPRIATSSIPSSNLPDKLFISSSKLSGFSFPKLTDEEIKKIPQFSGYDRGFPSRVLFIKNIYKRTADTDIVSIILAALNECGISDEGVSCKILKGRMTGSALVSCKDERDSTSVLECLNGFEICQKPLVVQFSSKNSIT